MQQTERKRRFHELEINDREFELERKRRLLDNDIQRTSNESKLYDFLNSLSGGMRK